MQFFLDGYDTLGSALGMTFYFLTVNDKVQEKLIDEVDELAEERGEEVDAESLDKLKYMDQVLAESGRLATLPWSYRGCTKDWPLPGSPNIIIPKGMRVMIPIYAIQVSNLIAM